MRATQVGSPLLFFGLVFAQSLPFWVISAVATFELLPGLPLAGDCWPRQLPEKIKERLRSVFRPQIAPSRTVSSV
jgi:hypothetical protein